MTFCPYYQVLLYIIRFFLAFSIPTHPDYHVFKIKYTCELGIHNYCTMINKLGTKYMADCAGNLIILDVKAMCKAPLLTLNF